MLQSILGHSSEQSIANMSSRPTVLQLKCVTNILSNWFKNHQTHKTNISTVTNAPFIQNSNQMASRLTATTSFSWVFFQLLQYSRQRASFSADRATLMTKADLTFPAFSSRFVDFPVSFCFRCKFSLGVTLESGLTVAWFSWTSHNSLLLKVTNKIASFWTDNRLREMAFFVFAKVGKGRLLRYVERFWNKKALSVVVCFVIL